MRVILIISYSLLSVIVFGQNPFNNTFGYSNFDASAVIVNYKSDSFLISITSEYQTDNYHSYLMELDNFGNKIKGNLINNKVIEINTIKEFFDTKYIINSGFYGINNSGIETDLLIQKIDTSGNEIWIKNYGGNQMDFSNDFEILADSGVIIVGTTESYGAGGRDVYIVRTNKNGDSLWTRVYGNSSGQSAYGIERESDSVYVVAGKWGNLNNNSMDAFAMKINLQGDTLDFRLYGNYLQNFGQSLCKTADNGYAIAGWSTYDYGGYYSPDAVLYKLDSNLNLKWTKYYGTLGNEDIFDVKQCFDGGFVLVGHSNGLGQGEDVYIVRTDSIGDTLWTLTLGGDYNDRAYSVVQTPDSGFAIVGNTYSYGAGGSDAFFLKLKPNGDITTAIGLAVKPKVQSFSIFPNPAKHSCSITFSKPSTGIIQIRSISGTLVNSYNVFSKKEIKISISSIAKGMYIIVFLPDNSTEMQYSKLIIQ